MSPPDESRSEYLLEQASDAVGRPVRLAVLQEDTRPQVALRDEPMVMTFPHLLVRELIVLVAVSLAIVVLALLFDAPLETLANPGQTPNPSKAPWYFLGLQELLHYYPPFVAGVVLPSLVVIALVIVPYFDVNLQRAPLWERDRQRRLVLTAVSTVVLCVVFALLAKHAVWPLIATTLVVAAPMMAPGLWGPRNRLLTWLGTRSLAFWIFTWFVIAETVLTIIGVFFRGPGWGFTLPWRDGIF